MVKAPGYKVEDCKGLRSDVSSKVVERVKKVVSATIWLIKCTLMLNGLLMLDMSRLRANTSELQINATKSPQNPLSLPCQQSRPSVDREKAAS